MKAAELIKEILTLETNITEADVIVDGECIGIQALPPSDKDLVQYFWLYAKGGNN